MVFYACFLFSTLMFWDFRFLLFFALIALFFVLTSRITWREMRRAWIFIGFFILFYTILTFLTGRGGMEVYEQETLITSIRRLSPFSAGQPTIEITVERIFFAISQFLRLFSISSHDRAHPLLDQPAALRHRLPRAGDAGQVRLCHGPDHALRPQLSGGISN